MVVGGEVISGGVRHRRCIVLVRRSGGDTYDFACPPEPRGGRTMLVAVAEAEAKREVDMRLWGQQRMMTSAYMRNDEDSGCGRARLGTLGGKSLIVYQSAERQRRLLQRSRRQRTVPPSISNGVSKERRQRIDWIIGRGVLAADRGNDDS